MSECYCDFDPPTVYRASQPIARKARHCAECAAPIAPGDRYEYVFAIWDGSPSTYCTCGRCLALRDYVQAHVPCLCYSHHNTIEDCIEAAREYAHEAPGLLFGAYRRLVAINRGRGFK